MLTMAGKNAVGAVSAVENATTGPYRKVLGNAGSNIGEWVYNATHEAPVFNEPSANKSTSANHKPDVVADGGKTNTTGVRGYGPTEGTGTG